MTCKNRERIGEVGENEVKPASVWVWTIFAVMVVVALAVWMQEVANVLPVVMGVAVMATIVIAVMEIAVIVAKIGVHVAVMVTKVIVVIGVPVMVICVAVMAMKVIVVIVVMGGGQSKQCTQCLPYQRRMLQTQLSNEVS